MAPELRKRKSVEAAKPAVAATTKAAPKAAPKPKRKATEEASPVSVKKQKPSKKPTVEKKPSKKAAKKETKSKKEEEGEEDEEMVEAEKEEKEAAKVEDEKNQASDNEDEPEEATELEEDDENLQVLAVDLDPEDEEETSVVELYKPGQDVGKIPKVSSEVQKAAQARSPEGSGVIYLGRIPHGFYENQMKQYLSQFGPILRLRLSRNKKTGASKHFAFIEFAEASTAEIVSKTMDNYLLFGHILKCKLVAKEQLHDNVWEGANRRFKKVPWNKMAGKKLEKPRTEAAWASKVAKEKGNRAKKAAKLKEIGYEFEAPKLKAVPAPAAIENGSEETKALEAAPEPEEPAADEKPEPEAEPEAEPEVIEEETKPKGTKAKKATKATPKAKETKTTRSKKAKA